MAMAHSPRTVIDCPGPAALAGFYGQILGWSVDGEGDWVDLRPDDRSAVISFQRVEDYREPQWPGQAVPQQMQLDLMVQDLDEGQARVLAVGGQLAGQQPGTSFRVFLDPVGHPFCLCAD